MQRKKFLLSILTAIFCINSFFAQSQNDLYGVFTTMIQRIKEIKTLKYHAIMNERINGKMVLKNTYFKINISPVKIYLSQSFLGIKLDALYVEGWNDNKLLVTTVGFPWLKMSLDPYSKKVRDNHHHTIFEAGYNYFGTIIEQILANHQHEITILNLGSTTLFNKNCYKLKIIVNNYRIISYNVQKGETLPIIAQKRLINDYKILELNPSIKDYYNVRPGQVIQVPNLYAKSLTLTIDQDTFLPLQIELYDEKGLYAIYGYKDVVVNCTFNHDEFSTTFKDYHF